jgi:parallel beta-helix repeat protein
MINITEGQIFQAKAGTRLLNNSTVPREVIPQKIRNFQALTPHEPILITSNDQFATLGFLGSGSRRDPYRIEGFEITSAESDLIAISDTSVAFVIADNDLNGLTAASSGISLSNVSQAIIENNLISDSNDGITVRNTSNTSFYNNNIASNNRFGMFLGNANNCTLSVNTIHGNKGTGVHLKETWNTTISNNTIYDHQDGDFTQSSILLDNSSSTVITHNLLSNSDYGINLLNSAYNNMIMNNTIRNNQKYGIRLEYASGNTIIQNNITKNLNYGILVTFGSNDNKIQFNSFTNNTSGETQAVDDGNNNIFMYNYWDEWPILDIDEDLIIDTPYPIDGNANNTDPYPLAEFSTEAIENTQKSSDNSWIVLFIGIILLVLGGSITIGYFITKIRQKEHDIDSEFELEKPFTEFSTREQIKRIKPIYHKLVVGVENLQTSTLPQPVAVPLLEAAEPVTLVEFLPSDIKEDLRSGMRWRTISTLIEIAYQDPTDTNPVKLAQNLDIPASTLSKEIKKLKELHYIESYASPQVLRDGRYRSYTITQKGFNLLYTLKETLKVTITRLKEKEGAFYV